ncbi:uncharacterized protein [Bemisia tabaci]
MGERRGTKALEIWCKRVTDGYSGVKVENMTTSWRDGLAFCALIHHFRPDLINFSALDKKDVYGNNDLAFRTAERHLGIPALLDAEDMVEYPVPDRLSVLTYLSQFYQVFASQNNSPAGKRASDTPDRPSLVMPSAGGPTPPSKIGAGVGRCRECEQSVFIAQRLVINGHLYHRICFRCARCNSQLSMANCYETQNAQFVCETCPDEECIDGNRIKDTERGHASPTHKKHFSDVPVSDNEKSTDNDQLALNNRNKRISLVSHRKMLFENLAGNEMNISSMTDDAKATKAASKQKTNDVITGDLDHVFISLKDELTDEVDQTPVPNIQPTIISDSHDKSSKMETQNLSNLLENKCSSNDFDNTDLPILRDKIDSDETHGTGFAEKLEESSKTASIAQDVSVHNLSYNKDDLNSLEKIKLKSSDDSLQSNNEGIDSINSIYSSSKDSSDIILSLETVNLNDSQLDSSTICSDSETADDVKEVSNKLDSETANDVKEVSSKLDNSLVSTNQELTDATSTVQNSNSESTCNNSDVVLPEDEIVGERISPLVFQEVNHTICDETSNSEQQFNSESCSAIEEIAEESISEIKEASSEKNSSTPLKPKSYPKGLNPFGDSDEEEIEETKLSETKPATLRKSINPFGSEFEEEDELGEDHQMPVPKPRTSIIPKSSAPNPFLSDDEVSDETVTTPPTPLARKLLPEESPLTPKSLTSRPSRRGSTTSIGSTVSTSTLSPHKKKPAPPPPSVLSPKYRKSKQAPPPPSMLPVSMNSSSPLPTSPSTSSLSSLSAPGSPKSLNKADKESANRLQRAENVAFEPHKSICGQWKRKKGPAPQRPIPIKRQVREPIRLDQIKQELADIEIKQQELERQGVKLEQSIRDRSADQNVAPAVEDMMSQLFELVNEKNELEKRQSELTYLRRQHHLEQEHADLEYSIRCLMLCPEANKTDSDKELEEQLIQRLVEVVERRNEIVENLEVDRQKEIEEQKNNTTVELYSLGSSTDGDASSKDKTLKKKEKKAKKAKKMKKTEGDTDKDADTSESSKKTNRLSWFGTLKHLPKKI